MIVPKTHLSAQVQVTIDEEDVGIYDAYAEYPGETQQVLYSNKQLGDGTHTITLTVVRNGDNTHLELDAFRVYQKI